MPWGGSFFLFLLSASFFKLTFPPQLLRWQNLFFIFFCFITLCGLCTYSGSLQWQKKNSQTCAASQRLKLVMSARREVEWFFSPSFQQALGNQRQLNMCLTLAHGNSFGSPLTSEGIREGYTSAKWTGNAQKENKKTDNYLPMEEAKTEQHQHHLLIDSSKN